MAKSGFDLTSPVHRAVAPDWLPECPQGLKSYNRTGSAQLTRNPSNVTCRYCLRRMQAQADARPTAWAKLDQIG